MEDRIPQTFTSNFFCETEMRYKDCLGDIVLWLDSFLWVDK